MSAPAAPSHAAALRFPLLVDNDNAYQHRYSSMRLALDKIAEIEKRLEAGDTTPGLVRQREELLAQVESSSARDHPSQKIATLNSLYTERNRILYARIEGGTPCFYLHPRPQRLLDEIVESLVWSDASAKNIPYSTLCVYPMTEPDRYVALSLDIEEEFLVPHKDEEDPPLSEVPTEDRENEARHRRLGKAGKYSRARQANLEALALRERQFAMRCRWVPILMRCSVLSLYGYDISDVAVYAYSGCTNAKNSFHLHFWQAVCRSTAEWRDILENAHKILDGLPDTHACKSALLRAGDCVRDDSKRKYIIDFGIANVHRQLRAAFQRKEPKKDNALVPYSIAAGARVQLVMTEREKVRDWLAPSVVGMAMLSTEELFIFGNEEFVRMRDDVWTQIESKLGQEITNGHDPTRNIVPLSITTLQYYFTQHVKPSTVGGAAQFREIKSKLRSLHDYLRKAVEVINNRLVLPEQKSTSREVSTFKRYCYRAFVFWLVSAALTNVLSHRDFANTTRILKGVADEPDEHLFEARYMPEVRRDRGHDQVAGDVRMIKYIINSVAGPYLDCVRVLRESGVKSEGLNLCRSLDRNQLVVYGMQRSLPDPDPARKRRDIVSDWDMPMTGVKVLQRYWFPSEQDRAIMRVINDKPEPTRKERANGLVSQIKTVTEMARDVERSSVLKRAVTTRLDEQPKKAPRVACVKVRRENGREVEVTPTDRFWASAFGRGTLLIESPLENSTLK